MSATQLKIMSFNLRVDNTGDGINDFTNRFDRVVEVLEKEKPDLIGFQEVTDGMRARLRDHLPGYTVQGCGREKNYHGESMLIAYRKDVVELISLENIWLSPTPAIPGSTFGGDQSRCPRMFTAALIKHNDVALPFYFINTHLDHKGQDARYLGAMQLVQYISTHREYFVLTGDFNATPEAREIKLITEALAHRGVVDCTADLGGTFHDFGRLLPDRTIKIDYIFTSKDIKAKNAHTSPIAHSDHLPLCATVEIL